MIEANDNIDLVTVRRQQEVRRAKEKYQRAVTEGRMAVKPRTPESAQLVVQSPHAKAVPTATTAVEQQPPLPTTPPADPEAAWRHTRLALTAGLVLLLLVVWIWQKKSGR